MTQARQVSRPVPDPDGLNAEWYSHCARGELRFQRCDSCKAWRHLPRLMCPQCGSSDWSWERSSGRGKIYTWTITHQAMHPAFTAEVPYAVIVVELDEGVRMVAGLRGLEPERLSLGLPVAVEFEPVADEVAMPWFRPVQAT
jgi:hypothetical protein